MLSPRNNHSAVSIGIKMFMLEGSSDYSKVLDIVTRNITCIKTLPKWLRLLKKLCRLDKSFKVVSIGHEIYFFLKEDNKVNVHIYDVENNRFSFKTSMEI